MATTLFKNEIFEITRHPERKPRYDYVLKYKGKTVPLKYATDDNEITVTLAYEVFLDFDAASLPHKFTFLVEDDKRQFLNTHGAVFISRNEGNVTLKYPFDVRQEEVIKMDINLIKILLIFFKMAIKAGYKTEHFITEGSDLYGGDIFVTFPAKGNLYAQYKKHLDIFEGFFNRSVKEVKLRICQ